MNRSTRLCYTEIIFCSLVILLSSKLLSFVLIKQSNKPFTNNMGLTANKYKKNNIEIGNKSGLCDNLEMA